MAENAAPSATAWPWRITRDGVTLAVRVTPRGGRDAIDGIEVLADGRRVLKLRVRVAPEDGEANRAVLKLVATALRLPVRAVRVLSGETARQKQIAIEGDGLALQERLVLLCGEAGPR